MDRLSSFAVDPVAAQLMLLNVLVTVYLICKGVAFVSAVLMRRDPPKKSIRSKLAQSNES
jgi:hypothetical protein